MKRRFELLAATVALLLILPFTAVPLAGSGNDRPYQYQFVKEFPLPHSGAGPWAITASRNGTIWFTENNVGSIGSFNPSTHSWHEYKVNSLTATNSSFPEIGYQMYGIALDAQGDVWFTSWQGDQIVEFNPSTLVFVPYIMGPEQIGALDNLEPYALMIQNNTVWFSLFNGESIGRLSPESGNITTYRTGCACPVGEIAPGPNGTVWFTIPESGVGKIGVFDPRTGVFQVTKGAAFDNGQYLLELPTGVAVDQSGRMWITDHGSDTINEFLPSLPIGNIPEVGYWTTPLPGFANRTEPLGIAVDGQGNIWFVEANANRIGVFYPKNQTMTEYLIPTPRSEPGYIAVDSQGRVWFTELAGNKLGAIDLGVPPPFSVSVPSANVSLPQGGTSSIYVDLKAASGYGPQGPLKVWVTGMPIQDVGYSFGSSNQISGGVYRFQLLLNASSSTPVGTYVATVSVASPSIIQGVVVNIAVTKPPSKFLPTDYFLVVTLVAVVLLVVFFLMRHGRIVERKARSGIRGLPTGDGRYLA